MNFGFSLQRRSCSKIQLNEGATEPLKLVVRSPFLYGSPFLSSLAEAGALLAPVLWCSLCQMSLEFGNGYDYEKQETTFLMLGDSV